MEKRPFGKTGWTVSEVGFGCWGMGGGWGRQDDGQAQLALTRALELGIDFFDTAYVYGDGRSETLLGQVLHKTDRPYTVATKVPSKTMEWPARPTTHPEAAFPEEWIVQCTQTSLDRLGLERIDLQQLHVWTDAWLAADGWKRAAERLKRDGKIRALGVSINDHQPESALKLVASGLIDSVQVIYNIFDQASAEALFALCQKHQVAVIVRVPFDEGGLTGTFNPRTRFEPGDWRSGYFKGERLTALHERVEQLKSLLSEETPTIPHLALKFCLNHPAVSTVIPGMRKVQHVEANARVSDGKPLSASVAQALKAHAWPRNFYTGAFE